MNKLSSNRRVRWSRSAALAILVATCVSPATASVVMNGTRFVYPYLLAAWRLRGHIRHDNGDIWTRAANYHSRTPRYNRIYRADLMRRAMHWSQWLDRYFPTHDAIVDSPAHGTS